MRAVGLLVLLLGLAAPPGSAGGEEDPALAEMSRLQGEMEKLMAELEPALAALRELGPRYGEGRDWAAMEAERSRLGADISRDNALLERQVREYEALVKERRFMQGAVLLQQALASGSGEPLAAGVSRIVELENFKLRVDAFTNPMHLLLRQDQEAFEAAVLARERSRRLRLAGLAAVGAAGGLAGLALVARRRRRARISAGPAPLLAPAGPAPRALPAGGVQAGTVLGERYRVLRRLDGGSLGAVYEAAETGSRRKVAIRVLREELHADEVALEALLASARACLGLRHPNIAALESVFVEGERAHLVAEHVSAASLRETLDQGRPLSLPSAAGLLGQCAAALDCAHGRGLVHGDLRPAHVLVGADGAVRLKDFGLHLAARKAAARLAWRGALGHPAYLSPEAELGSSGREADIFALGVLAYEMLTCGLPFEGPNFLAQKRELSRLPPSPGAPLPAGADAVLLRALSPEPALRHGSAGELAAAFSGLAGASLPPGAG